MGGLGISRVELFVCPNETIVIPRMMSYNFNLCSSECGFSRGKVNTKKEAPATPAQAE